MALSNDSRTEASAKAHSKMLSAAHIFIFFKLKIKVQGPIVRIIIHIVDTVKTEANSFSLNFYFIFV